MCEQSSHGKAQQHPQQQAEGFTNEDRETEIERLDERRRGAASRRGGRTGRPHRRHRAGENRRMARPQRIGSGLDGREVGIGHESEKRGSGRRAREAAPAANAEPTRRQALGHQNRQDEDVDGIAPTGWRRLARPQDAVAMRYRCVSLRIKNDRSATAMDASVAPSSEAVASLTKVLPGAITVATPSSFRK